MFKLHEVVHKKFEEIVERKGLPTIKLSDKEKHILLQSLNNTLNEYEERLHYCTSTPKGIELGKKIAQLNSLKQTIFGNLVG